MEIKCYTDGSLVNEGRYKGMKAGAWAYKIITNEENSRIEFGTQVGLNSTLMEIEAIKQLLLNLKNIKNDLYNVQVIIFSDCQSVVNNINNMINKEQIKLKAKTREIYNEVINLIKSIEFKVSLEWIRGHTDNLTEENVIHNKDVDILAREKARMLATEIKSNKSKKTNKKGHGTPNMITKAPEKMDRYIHYSDILISNLMKKCAPRENKKLNKFKRFAENNSIEKAIEVQRGVGGKYYLTDGYISYLWLREMNEQWIPVKLV